LVIRQRLDTVIGATRSMLYDDFFLHVFGFRDGLICRE
jgi:hypothetical protein